MGKEILIQISAELPNRGCTRRIIMNLWPTVPGFVASIRRARGERERRFSSEDLESILFQGLRNACAESRISESSEECVF
jgi:hypothetical protein